MITSPITQTRETTQEVYTDTAYVNFESTDDINGFATLLCRRASDCGFFITGLRPSKQLNEIKTAAREWIIEVNRRLPEMSPGDAFSIMGGYDIVHRIAYNVSANPRFINGYVLRAFEAMIAGDLNVDRYDMFHTITEALNRHDTTYIGRPLQWTSTCVDRWYNRYKSSPIITVELDDYHIIRQVTALLSSDLWAYETRNEDRFKHQLFDRYRHYLDNLSNQDLKTLMALDLFLTVSIKFFSSEEFEMCKSDLKSAILARHETNRFNYITLAMRPKQVDERTAS